MRSEFSKRILIVLMLGLLTASAFFMRLENFKNSEMRSIDEIVYYRMAGQILEKGLSGYNTIPYGEELAATGRPLPEYFFQPLFKHPPVFTFLIALSMNIFGSKLIAAEYIPLLFSVLMIPLIYLLGAFIYDRRVGALAAFFLWIDPVSIICSQKVWMDSTIAFFTLLSALFFVWGLRRDNGWLYIFSGIASGLAVNTKYTGIFITLIIALFCGLYRWDLFKNKKFQLSLILPFLMLAPWIYWNYKVYGMTSVLEHDELRRVYEKLPIFLPLMAILIAAAFLLFGLWRRSKKSTVNDQEMIHADEDQRRIKFYSILVPIGFFAFLVPKQFLHSLQFTYLPTHSWSSGIFAHESAVFYFGRLIEYSLIYALSIFSVLMYHSKERNEAPFIRLCAMVILMFFVFWGGFQTRYILSSLPFLIILGAQFWSCLYEASSGSGNALIYFTGRMSLNFLFFYIVAKSCYFNLMVSFPNDLCYF